MCGIAGFIDKKNILKKDQLLSYNSAQKKRGPDGSGIFFQATDFENIGLAHVRLSILDLSDLGKQPMSFEHLTIILNGEIYNYKSIKNNLIQLGYLFASNSDTEVVLKAFHAWGLSCVEKFRGMFSFAICDLKESKLYLCRDRVGVKPLYYFINNDQFIFGSELKVFFITESFQTVINLTSLGTFLNFGYVTHPHTILEGVMKADPGSWTILDFQSMQINVHKYWNYSKIYEKEKFSGSFDEAVKETERIAKEACELRMISDVPVGVFLSGGFDSTLVTTLLQKDRTEKLKTFTIGFSDGIDESKDAEKIAKYLGTSHISYDCQQLDAMKLIPDLPELFDDPIADISCIPTMLVSKLAKEKVTVALSADGGDELFGGYGGFSTIPKRLKQINNIPWPNITGCLLKSSASFFKGNFNHINKKAIGISEVLLSEKANKLYQFQIHQSSLPNEILEKLLLKNAGIYLPIRSEVNYKDKIDEIYVHGMNDVLRDLLLVKVDRATMGYSLEGREPLLDQELIEFAASLPYNYKNDGKISKRPIREIVYQYIPKEIMDRPKIGFDLPIYKWLKEDLSFLLNDYLSEKAILETGVFNYNYVKELIYKFNNEGLRFKTIIWRILIFQMWYKRWMNNKSYKY